MVREFDPDRGWGVLDAVEAPGGCWVHFSAVVAPGYRSLSAGQRVFFRVEAPGQDGYPYRATKVWSEGSVEPPDRGPDGDSSSVAYRSTLTIVNDEPPHP
ncbi:cold shock domain-containing protein [Plantactinospora sp. B6F1]|uniref:cold-shock protein n=1 Tax=Plantactinospora sp. B6F1 TaxID=3158971 RepID=UPI0032D934B3